MNIVLNGTPREVSAATTSIAALLADLELSGQPVIIERNGLAVLRCDCEATPIAEGDVIEIVRMVAGG
jgi:sulfur carrier protein